MKRFALILTLIAFMATGWAEAAHAVAADMTCSHMQMDADDAGDGCAGEDTREHTDADLCLDCCCHHTHIMIKLLPPAVSQMEIKASLLALSSQKPQSRDLSPLYRPPIV